MDHSSPETKKTVLKTSFLLMLFSIATLRLCAQDITFNVSAFQGGYNISCHGQSNGSIDATIVGGTLPYTYSWSNGATTQDLSGLTAGSYTLTVTDSLGSIVSKAVTLFEPDSLTASLTPSSYNGYGLSAWHAYDGFINTHVSGGAPPYDYIWPEVGVRDENVSGLMAGTYSLEVTDQNGCFAGNSTTLTEPAQLLASIASYKNVSCYNGTDGEIKLTGSGGVPPYTTQWNNGSFSKNQLNIPAGDYEVLISDKNKTAHITLTITITQPAALTPVLTTSAYPNGYNVECSDCANGTVTLGLSGGTAPMSYLWTGTGVTGQTTADLSGLNAGYYSLSVTDANGCTANSSTLLTAPFNGWDKTGNNGDSTSFIGTVNNTPLIFKSNNTERMRMLPDGNIGIGTGNPVAKLDVNGDLRSTGSITFGSDQTLSYAPAAGPVPKVYGWAASSTLISAVLGLPYCFSPTAPAINVVNGMNYYAGYNVNGGQLNVMRTGFDGANGIIDVAGTNDAGNGPNLLINYYCGKDVGICTGTNGGNVFMTTATGSVVGIGDTYVPSGYKLAVKGKIIAEEVTVKLRGDWGDYIFEPTYKLMTLQELESYLKTNKHLPEIPSAKTIEKEGINTSELIMQLVKQQEQLTLYILEQNKRIEELEKKVTTVK